MLLPPSQKTRLSGTALDVHTQVLKKNRKNASTSTAEAMSNRNIHSLFEISKIHRNDPISVAETNLSRILSFIAIIEIHKNAPTCVTEGKSVRNNIAY